MAKIRIGNLDLGVVPRVVGIIDRPIPAARLQGFVSCGVDIFEVRADLFGKPIRKVADYIASVAKSVDAPLIGTVRKTDLNRANRAAWLKTIAQRVDCLDIELDAPERSEVAADMPDSTPIMVSEHDYRKTPDIGGLNDIVRRAVDQGARIVKIAVTANRPEDLTRLLRFTEECEIPIVSMAMGDMGAISRVVAPLFGSLLSYGYLRKPLVPGQLPALRIASALNEYFPARRAFPANLSDERD